MMRANKAQLSPSSKLYSILIQLLHDIFFQTKSFSFTEEARATPVQDTAQRRHRRRRAVGTRCKDSFQIKTLRKPFLLSLVDTHPPVSYHNRGGGWRFGIGRIRSSRLYLDTRGLGHCSAWYHKDRTPQGVFGVSS